jgi:hypothetical protein
MRIHKHHLLPILGVNQSNDFKLICGYFELMRLAGLLLVSRVANYVCDEFGRAEATVDGRRSEHEDG